MGPNGSKKKGERVQGGESEVAKSRQEEEKEAVLTELEDGPASKRELFSGEPSGTQNRALRELKKEYRVIHSPGAGGYVSLSQARYCVACADSIQEGSGRCENAECVQPQQRVRCTECGTWYLIDPYPLPKRIPEREIPDWYLSPRARKPVEEGEAEEHHDLALKIADWRVGLDWACPACANVWTPPDPWPYPLQRGHHPPNLLDEEEKKRTRPDKAD